MKSTKFSAVLLLTALAAGLVGYYIGSSSTTEVGSIYYTSTVTVEKTITTFPTITQHSISEIKADLTAYVYRVVDGDTFDGFPCGRVRLADINTPERGEVGYSEAKEALTDWS